MTVLIVVGTVAAVCLLAAADQLIKLRRRAQQRRQMAYRLTAAAARAEVAERKRKAAVRASAELTSVIPAINQPRPTFDSVARQAHNVPPVTGPQRLAARTQRLLRTGPQRLLGTGPQRAATGPQRAGTGPLGRAGAVGGASRARGPEQPPRAAAGGQQHSQPGETGHSAE